MHRVAALCDTDNPHSRIDELGMGCSSRLTLGYGPRSSVATLLNKALFGRLSIITILHTHVT